MKKIIFLLLVSLMAVGTLQAQNWDIHTTQTINGWKMHELSRKLSHSGLILPVGVPTAMGIYALVRKDEFQARVEEGLLAHTVGDGHVKQCHQKNNQQYFFHDN